MWIRKAKYQEVIDSYEDRIESLSKQNLDLMSLLPRSQVLGTMPYKHLVKFAEKEYGIQPRTYADKADLILEITSIEHQLRKIGAIK